MDVESRDLSDAVHRRVGATVKLVRAIEDPASLVGPATARALLVSVLMPCFNAPGHYLREAAASVLGQGANLELLIQDGRSTRADTRSALADISGDPRVRLVSEPDSGQSDALNKALARARGEVTAWLNADDVYVGDVIPQLLTALADDPILDGVYGDMEVRNARGETIRRFRTSPWAYDRVYRRGCYVFSGALLLRTPILRGVGGFDPSLSYCMDFDMYLRLGRTVSMSRLPGGVAALRIHRESKTGSSGRKFAGEALKVRLHHASKHRERLLAYYLYARTQAVVMTQHVRMTRAYARIRGERTL